MVYALFHIILFISSVSISLQNNGLLYSREGLEFTSLFDAVENFDHGSDNILLCIVGLPEDDISTRHEYGLNHVNKLDDNCDDLINLFQGFSNDKNAQFYIVSSTEEITQSGIYLMGNLPLESEISELLSPGQFVTIALTTCSFPANQPILSQKIKNDLNTPLNHKRLIKNLEQSGLGNGKLDYNNPDTMNNMIPLSSLQVEQIIVIFSIFFVVVFGSLLMINISTPNSVKQSIKLTSN